MFMSTWTLCGGKGVRLLGKGCNSFPVALGASWSFTFRAETLQRGPSATDVSALCPEIRGCESAGQRWRPAPGAALLTGQTPLVPWKTAPSCLVHWLWGN